MSLESIKEISVLEQQNRDYILIFTTYTQTEHLLLLERFGNAIQVEISLNPLGGVYLEITSESGQIYLHETLHTLESRPALGWLKSRLVYYWTTAYNHEGREVLHAPARILRPL